MQEYLSPGHKLADYVNLKNIFSEHKDIFKQYADLNVPKHVLKKMIKELQDYHSKADSYAENQTVQTTS